jgi:hypothetical protein
LKFKVGDGNLGKDVSGSQGELFGAGVEDIRTSAKKANKYSNEQEKGQLKNIIQQLSLIIMSKVLNDFSNSKT